MHWQRHSPRIYRFLDKDYVDQFFLSGKLRLSSFAKFGKHDDEQRLDGREGTITILCRMTEADREPLLIQAVVGTDAYVMSACLVPSEDVMCAFNTNSAIVIRDPVAFALAVARKLRGFAYGFDGPCSYQSRRFIYGVLSNLEPSLNSVGTDITISKGLPAADRMSEYISTVARLDPYFLKHHSFMHQNEWRFVWIVDGPCENTIDIEVPDARHFCEPWGVSTDFVAFNNSGPLEPRNRDEVGKPIA